jgi:ribonuclease E
VKLVEVGLYDPNAAVAKLDGLVVVVAGAAKLVGKTVNTRVNRVLDGTAYATMLGEPAAEAPITAEREAEKPTRTSRPKGAAAKPVAEAKPEPTDAAADEVVADEVDPEADAGAEPEAEVEQAAEDGAGSPAPKKKTRRGTRGGRRRRKTGTAASATAASANGGVPADAEAAAPKIHIPDRRLDEEAEPEDARPDAVAEPEAAEDGAEPKPKKKTRRGSRGGRRRRKPAGTTTAVAEQADEPSETAA